MIYESLSFFKKKEWIHKSCKIEWFFLMDISLTQSHFYLSKIRIMSNNRTNNGLNNTKIYLVCSEMIVTVALNKFGTPIALCAVSIPNG